MLLDATKNFAKATVSTGYDASATSIVLTTNHGANLPAIATAADQYNLVWWNATDFADPSDDPNVEIVRVTARSTDTLTVTRAQEGTTAKTHNSVGKTYKMALCLTDKMIDDLNQRKYANYPIQDFAPAPFAGLSLASNMFHTFQSGHGFTFNGSGSQTDDTTTFLRGSQSLRINTNGAGATARSRKLSLSPTLNLTGKQIVIQARVSSMANLNTFFLYLSSDNLSSHFTVFDIAAPLSGQTYLYFVDGEWITIILNWRYGEVTGTPDRTAINSIQFAASDRNGQAVQVWVGLLGFIPEAQEGVVTFTFDDGYDTQFTQARKILDKYGYGASAYIIPSVVDTAGQMTTAQLNQLYYQHGWDICTQGDDVNLTTRNAAQIEEDFLRNKNYLYEKGWHRGASHYAYPQGAFDYATIIPIIRKYWTSARGIIYGNAATRPYMETIPIAEFYKLKAFDVRNSHAAADIASRIAEAKANKEWLILNFHRIETPADDIIKYTPTDFETIVDACATQAIRVLPMSEVFRQFHKLHNF